MTQEIVHTSAERGLKQGSHGFCTVRATSGMPHNLSVLLEKLTAYNHAYKHFERKVDDHPVNYAHYTTIQGGTRYHILGKVSNAPLDHTSRSNKLAHLVAFDETEIDFSNTAGPAAECLAFENNDLWISEWRPQDEPKILPNEKRITLPVAEVTDPEPCEAWKQVTGNSTWAAVLASRDTDQPVTVIFSDRQKELCLKLVAEALSLIPPQQRWDVTFSTYFSSSLPTKVKCRWQFLLETTELGQKARRSLRGDAIDLPRIFEERLEPEVNELSKFAESWERPWSLPGEPPLEAGTASAVDAVTGNAARQPRRAEVRSGEESETLLPLPEEVRLASTRRRLRKLEGGEKSRRWRLWSFSTAVIVFAAAAIAISYLGSSSETNDVFSETVAKSDERKIEQQEQTEQVEQEKQARQQRRHVEAETAESDLAAVIKPDRAETAIETVDAKATITDPLESTAQVETAVALKRRPLDDVRERGKRLVLPLPSAAEPMDLAKIYVDSVEDCELDVVGEESVLKRAAFELAPEDPQEGLRTWSIKKVATAGLVRNEPVGVFTLDGQKLSFEWDSLYQGAELRNCLLRIKAKNSSGADQVSCILRDPDRRPRLKMSFDSKAEKIELLGPDKLSDTTNIRFEFRLDESLSGQLRCKGKGKTSLRVDERSKIELFEEPKRSRAVDEPALVEITLTLLASPQNHAVYLQRETSLRRKELIIPDFKSSLFVSADDEIALKWPRSVVRREPFSRGMLVQIEKQASDNVVKLDDWIKTLKDHKTRVVAKRGHSPGAARSRLDDDEQIKDIDERIKDITVLMGNLQKERAEWAAIPRRAELIENLFLRVETEAALPFRLVLDMHEADTRSVVLVESAAE